MTKEEVLRKIEECIGSAKIPRPRKPKKIEGAALKAPSNAKSSDSLRRILLRSQLDDDFADAEAVLSQAAQVGRRGQYGDPRESKR
jgi:hypothetical protein